MSDQPYPLRYRMSISARADTLQAGTIIQYRTNYLIKIGIVKHVLANINGYECRVFLENGIMLTVRDNTTFQTLTVITDEGE